MIKLSAPTQDQKKEYLEDVHDRYKEALANLKNQKIKVSKRKNEPADSYRKRKQKNSEEANQIISFLSVNGNLDDAKIDKLLSGEVPYLEKAITKIGPIKSNEIRKEFERVYTNFSNRSFGYRWAEKLGVTVCPYCNRSYIFTVGSDKGHGKARPQYDHFFPKSIYPYLAVSIYNLIPSCAVCNSGKSDVNSFENGKVKYLNPYVEGYGTKTVLRVSAKRKKERIHGYLGLAEEYTVLPESSPEVDNEMVERIKNTWELLKLGPLYEKHSDYIRNILQAKQIYSEEYLDQLMKTFPSTFKNIDDLKNAVYFNYLDEEDWGRRILAKLTHDLEVENS